jgi:hypothetical protein
VCPSQVQARDCSVTDSSGWAWFIPLHNGTTSIGIVMDQKLQKARREGSPSAPLSEMYRDYLTLAPGVMHLIGDGYLVSAPTSHEVGITDGGMGNGGTPGTHGDACVKSAADFSYSAGDYAGNGFRIVGDAGCKLSCPMTWFTHSIAGPDVCQQHLLTRSSPLAFILHSPLPFLLRRRSAQ